MVDYFKNKMQWYQWTGNVNAAGQNVYFPGVTLNCFYQGGAKVINNSSGVSTVSTGEVFVGTKVSINDRIEVEGKLVTIINFSDNYDIEGKFVYRTLYIG